MKTVQARLGLVASLVFAMLSFSAALSVDSAADRNRPISRVITLLRDMLKTMEKDAKEDQEVYDKLACWCQTNDRAKTEAINDAEVKIENLHSEIKEKTAESASLDTTVKNRESEVEKNNVALDQATAIRTKEMAAFKEEEKDLVESIRALKAAIAVLSKHNTGLMQLTHKDAVNVQAALARAMSSRHIEGTLTHKEKRQALAFIQQEPSGKEPGFNYKLPKQSYAGQSGEIFGILSQMLETFESNLANAKKEEEEASTSYGELKGAKENQIQAGNENIATDSQELADTDQNLALAKEDKADTTEAMNEDIAFLQDVTSRCEMTDKEWESRKKTRQAEMTAVSEALSVLSGDEAHDTFTRTFNAAFLQKSSRARLGGRSSRALAFLKGAARKIQSPRLAMLSVGENLDSFARVRKAIDDMVAMLMAEKEDEIKHRDFCVAEFNKNEIQTDKKTAEHKDLLKAIEQLENEIKTLTDEIAALNKEIADLELQLKHAGEDREKQNKEFQVTLADQRETQKILTAALDVLAEYYAKKAPVISMVQRRQEPETEMPEGFKEYKDSAGSQGVMKLMESIIADAKDLERQTMRDEEDAQKSYEDFVKDSNGSIEAKKKTLMDKTETKAQKEAELHEEKHPAREAAELDLEQLGNYKGQLHESCDFVLRNFEMRQAKRDEEVQALREAKAILAGSDYNKPTPPAEETA